MALGMRYQTHGRLIEMSQLLVVLGEERVGKDSVLLIGKRIQKSDVSQDCKDCSHCFVSCDYWRLAGQWGEHGLMLASSHTLADSLVQ